MKKISMVLLSLLLLSFVFVGCGLETSSNIETSQDQNLSSTLGKTCGTIVGIPCSRGEYCQYAGCGADMSGVCRRLPKACTREYVPVCGCDGNTYGNKCSAASAGVTVDHNGVCKP